ncbi:MAG: GAF domain-containing protein [Elusimicrobia bacterium]|nr:GAF domain-containing protein [Elusimicrobiota bacterium]
MFTFLVGLIGVIVGVVAHRYLTQLRDRHLRALGVPVWEDLRRVLDREVSQVESLLALMVGVHEKVMASTGTLDRDHLAEAILDATCHLFKTDSGSLMTVDPQRAELEVLAARGMPPEIAKAVRVPVGEGIAGRVAQTGRAIVVRDIETDARFQKVTRERYAGKSFLSAPMSVKNRMVGVLNVSHPTASKAFSEFDARLLSVLANHAAMALENVELYHRVQGFYFELAEAMARTIDVKDAYGREEAAQARRLARAVCEELKLPEALIQQVEFAALLHDVGKVALPEELLKKPGKLSSEEYQEVKRHAEIGYQMVTSVSFLQDVAPMIRYHQEWYNGQGYPEGLMGEEIPLGARVVAVIDAFRAMTADRPYRKAMPLEAAKAELERAAGTQFDPKVVEAFLRVVGRAMTASPA